MKSNNNIVFQKLLKEIGDSTGLSDKEISIKVGRNSGFISQLKSRIKNNGEEVSQKLIDILRLHFANTNIFNEDQADYINVENTSPLPVLFPWQ